LRRALGSNENQLDQPAVRIAAILRREKMAKLSVNLLLVGRFEDVRLQLQPSRFWRLRVREHSAVAQQRKARN